MSIMRLRLPAGSLVLGLSLAAAFSTHAQVLNDGTTTNNLIRQSSQGLGGDAEAFLLVDNGRLQAFQSGLVNQFPFVPLKTVWYSTTSFNAVDGYTIKAAFSPATGSSFNRGGVMGWLNTNSLKGIALEVVPGETQNFRLSTVDFSPSGTTNLSTVSNLFNLNGTPATGTSGSAWVGSTNYNSSLAATFQLEFALPTPADQAALTNVTARVIGTVAQGGTNLVTLTLLTDLPAPNGPQAGYFGYWAPEFTDGVIGYFDNLTLTRPVGLYPTLNYAHTNGQLTLSWEAGFSTWTLESTTNITNAVWTARTTATNQFIIPATQPMEFFRLRR